MTIRIGDRLPDGEFIIKTDDGLAKLSVSELTRGRKVVLFAVPGAFTPTCHANHLPGYLEHIEAIRDKGVDEVAVVSVNDPHVMNAWAKATKADGKILFLSDGSADFARAIGMDVDLGAAGMGIRSKRYSMIVDDGVVTKFNEGEKPGQVTISSAATLLEQL